MYMSYKVRKTCLESVEAVKSSQSVNVIVVGDNANARARRSHGGYIFPAIRNRAVTFYRLQHFHAIKSTGHVNLAADKVNSFTILNTII